MTMVNIFGSLNTIKVLDYLIESKNDISILDIMKDVNLSRKTSEKIINHFFNKKIIVLNRKVGKTKMYKLNNGAIVTKILELREETKNRGCE